MSQRQYIRLPLKRSGMIQKTLIKPSVLLLALTGIAAINIEGNTINSGLAISKNIFGEHVGALSDERESALRTKLSNLKLLVIDEASMVSSLMLKPHT